MCFGLLRVCIALLQVCCGLFRICFALFRIVDLRKGLGLNICFASGVFWREFFCVRAFVPVWIRAGSNKDGDPGQAFERRGRRVADAMHGGLQGGEANRVHVRPVLDSELHHDQIKVAGCLH